MTDLSTFAEFSARLREFILASTSAGDSAAEFNQLALALFQLQFAHNAPYQKLCRARDVTAESVADWKQIPAAPTAAFKELELTSLPVAERTMVFHSSGTTDQRRSQHFHNVESLALYEASLRPWFQRHLLPEAELPAALCFVALTPTPREAPHSSLVHMLGTVRAAIAVRDWHFTGRVGPDGVWELDLPATVAALRTACVDARPVVLLGTAFSFVHLLDHCMEMNLRFPLLAGSRVMETGGYKGRSRTLAKADLHALITERLGLPTTQIVCEYGMSELSSQAYDRIAGDASPPSLGRSPAVDNLHPLDAAGWKPAEQRQAGSLPCYRPPAGDAPQLATLNSQPAFHFPPWARVRVVSPEDGREVAEGETGLLQIFDLANVRSVLAVQTEDLAVRRGDGFELLGRAALAEPRGCSLMAA